MPQSQPQLPPCEVHIQYNARCAQLKCQNDFRTELIKYMETAEPDFTRLASTDKPKASTKLFANINKFMFFELIYAESDAAPAAIREAAIAKRLEYTPHLTAAFLGFRHCQKDDPLSRLMDKVDDWEREFDERAGREPQRRPDKVQKAGHKSMPANARDVRLAERWVRAGHAYHLIRYGEADGNSKPIIATDAMVQLLERVGGLILDRQVDMAVEAAEAEDARGVAP